MINYKMLAIDLDGTLLSKLKIISKNNIKALREYVNEGGIPVVTTGRSIASAAVYAKKIQKFTNSQAQFVIAFNGAYIKNLKTNEVVEQIIPSKIVKQILKFVNENNLILWIYTKSATRAKSVVVTKTFANVFVKLAKNVRLIKLNRRISDLAAYKLNILSFSKEKVKNAYKVLSKKYTGKLEFSFSHKKLIEVNLGGVNKGVAIKYVAQKINVPLTNVAAIGDSNNDLSAFNVAKFSVALRTKSDILKKTATKYLDFKKDGVAYAINKFILQKDDKIKLIASDLDGTLLEPKHKTIDNHTAKIIKDIVDNHQKTFVICSGRGIDDAMLVVKHLNVKHLERIFVICVNGSLIYDPHRKSIIYNKMMKENEAKTIYRIFKEFHAQKNLKGEIGLQMFSHYSAEEIESSKPKTHYWINDKWIITYSSSRHPGLLKNFWAKKNIKTLNDNSPFKNVLKFIFVFEFPEDKARMQAILNKYKYDYVISSSSKKNIEINALGVNKGNALVHLCNFLNIDTKNIMTIGDEHNDVPMLKLTPYSVSFHSSPSDVKQYAKFIFDLPPSVLVGKAIEKIILKNDN